jgi:hypothetical protein
MENKYSTDFDFQSKLQAAISGELNDSEKENLKALIDSDKDANEEYVFSEKLSKTLKNQDILAVSALIGNIIEAEGLPDISDLDTPSDKPEPSPQYAPIAKAASGIKFWLIGITIASMVAAGVYVVYEYKASQERNRIISISNKYLQSLENDLYTQTFKQGMNDLDMGMEAYNNKDYAKAVTLLGKHYKQTNDEMVGLYLSISMLLNGENNSIEAEKILSTIKTKLPPPIVNIADWYLILAKLKVNKADEAAEMLKKITKDSPYHSKAVELSADLKTNQ